MLEYVAPDGLRWAVEVAVPGASNAMVIFRHPAGRTNRRDRYNWIISTGPEARSVTSRLSIDKVQKSLDQDTLARLFRRSMPISRPPSGAPEPAMA
ncbi:MAG TPA: hypothetical protein VEA99_02740 [Gemmatimonadaceae bacterium]|nr:hypothetical protein [Gemmatimonadaceae bacterium]